MIAADTICDREQFWTREPLVVASLPLARQAGYRDRLSRIEYDLVILDEAHALKNRAGAGWQLENDLEEALPAAAERDARRQQPARPALLSCVHARVSAT